MLDALRLSISVYLESSTQVLLSAL